MKAQTIAIRLRLLPVTVVAVSFIVFGCQKPPRSRAEAVDRMVQLQESGHYEDAVRVVQDWMHQQQNDTSMDDFLQLQISMVYITEAYREKSRREESLRNAAAHLQQALNLNTSKKREEVETTLDGIGGAYEILGDLSEKDRCQSYTKARKVFQDDLPLIKGDSYTAHGATLPLEPFRSEIRKHLRSVEEKIAQAHCTGP